MNHYGKKKNYWRKAKYFGDIDIDLIRIVTSRTWLIETKFDNMMKNMCFLSDDIRTWSHDSILFCVQENCNDEKNIFGIPRWWIRKEFHPGKRMYYCILKHWIYLRCLDKTCDDQYFINIFEDCDDSGSQFLLKLNGVSKDRVPSLKLYIYLDVRYLTLIISPATIIKILQGYFLFLLENLRVWK